MCFLCKNASILCKLSAPWSLQMLWWKREVVNAYSAKGEALNASKPERMWTVSYIWELPRSRLFKPVNTKIELGVITILKLFFCIQFERALNNVCNLINDGLIQLLITTIILSVAQERVYPRWSFKIMLHSGEWLAKKYASFAQPKPNHELHTLEWS